MIVRREKLKMFFNNKFLSLIFVFVIFVFCILNVSAINIGVSPATISFDKVLREGYAERSLIVSTDSIEPVKIKFSPKGEIASWINYSSQEEEVSKDNFLLVNVFVVPPSDVPNGNYSGFLRITTESFGEGIDEHAVGRVISSLDVLIKVVVVDDEVISCSVSDLDMISAEEGDDVILKMSVRNNGNVRLNPSVFVDIWDFNQISVVKNEEFVGESILPTTKRDFEFRIKSNDLDIGQYWSDVLVYECDADSTLTFDVLKQGSLSASGVLLSILMQKESSIDETVPVEVNFKNTGEKEVEAYFKGEVSLGGKIVQVFESEKLLVPKSSIEKFNFYFTPKKAGRYVVSGRVFYAGKKTFESSTTIDILSNGFNVSFLLWFVYAFFFVTIGFLFFKVRKERRIYLNKLRKLK